MKFEEILPFMREGKKVRHARMKEGEYWICCNAAFTGTEQTWPTLTRAFKNPFDKEVVSDGGSYAWGIERWAIMDETWEIIED
jgi:hypothetical protein